MLRQVYIIKDSDFLYERIFGKALDRAEFITFFNRIKMKALSFLGKESEVYDYYKFKIIYTVEKDSKLFFIFIFGNMDDIEDVKYELKKLKKEFLNLFRDMLDGSIDPSMIEVINPTVDSIHRNLRPKVTLVGFSGVGKTTITKLIRAEEIPVEHIPTITGEISSIKIGKLHFHLWDFAGQEQFSYLWEKFLVGSDAVLLITDSTLANIEKSRFFLELIQDEGLDENTALIGNKQDLPDALPVEKIEELLGLKTYPMVAIDSNNRDKMVQIIADVLEINTDASPLLKPLFKRDQLITESKQALEDGDIERAAKLFEQISNICLEVGDDSLSKEFNEKYQKLSKFL